MSPFRPLGLVLLGLIGCLGSACHPLGGSHPTTDPGSLVLETNRLTARTLGLIVNQRDPLSVKIADYYQQRRGIPAENVVQLEFDPQQTILPEETFQALWTTLQAQTPTAVQAYALTWAQPYRVGCMSITAAFTFGYDPAYCATGCAPTAISPYFDSLVSQPAQALNLRPTMALAATSLAAARQLIERGIAADHSAPLGTAYLLSTDDPARNVRSAFYADVQRQLAPWFYIQILNGNYVSGRVDVMFYFTGLAQVPALATNQFRPGAVADHLTSFGGQLTDSSQMSSLRWLEAGATGSYGTVVEPCNFPQKFPHPGVLMAHYLKGDTLIEAYWKSVLMPGQGIFIGEPLARPFSRPLQSSRRDSLPPTLSRSR